MSTANEPIMLNETGLSIIDAVEQENALLSMMVESARSIVYSNISQVANIVRNGHGRDAFPIGDQIIIPWKDLDSSDHNTDETAYQVPLDVVHHGRVELETGEIIPGMFLQWHFCSPYGVQFSKPQAFMDCQDGLAAGEYYITFGSSWGSAITGESWRFTLTQSVPAGGRISGFETDNSENWTVKTWTTPASDDPIETVQVTNGVSGTSLGTLNYATLSEDGLNSMSNVMHGNNRWKTSALRQYLNKAGLDWFTSQTDFDLRPDEYAKHGFLDGFDEAFLSAIKPVKVVTALNTVEGYTATTDATYDKFFVPSLEQINATPQLSTVEGTYFEYWRRRFGLNEFASRHPTLHDGYKTPAINAQASPQYIRLRSALQDNAYTTWCVSASGCVYGYDSTNLALRFSPVCVIC